MEFLFRDWVVHVAVIVFFLECVYGIVSGCGDLLFLPDCGFGLILILTVEFSLEVFWRLQFVNIFGISFSGVG